jgi:hypothetical protein
MEKTKFETLLEEGAVEGLEKVIVPFIRGKIPGDKIDGKKLNASLQVVSSFRNYQATKMHNRGLNLVAIRMMTGEDKDAAKAMIQKHFDSALQLPPGK